MKKVILALVGILLVLPVTASAENLVKDYHNGSSGNNDFGIDIWVDNDDGIYYEGDPITVYFQATQDCYLAIYSIDTRGEVNLLFPAERYENGFIEGGETYAIPASNDNYDLVVNGPEGIEHIVAVAGRRELDIPNWYGGAPVDGDYYEDREDFIKFINDRYFNCRWGNCERAFDRATIYIKVPQYYYKPVYVPTSWYDYPDYSYVYIDYPYGAEIYIDGIFFGIAPIYIPRVYWGWHWFTIYDRYGYCWESDIHIYDQHEFHFDRTRVKTSRTTISRFKDIRQQAKKYDRTTFVKSDQRVISSRSSYLERSKDQVIGTASKSSKTYKTTDSRAIEKQTTKREKSEIYQNKSGDRQSTDGISRSSSGRVSSDRYKQSSSSSSRSSSGSVSTRKSGNSSDATSRKSTVQPKKSGDTQKAAPATKSSPAKKSSGTVKKAPEKSSTDQGRSSGGGSSKRSSGGGGHSRP